VFVHLELDVTLPLSIPGGETLEIEDLQDVCSILNDGFTINIRQFDVKDLLVFLAIYTAQGDAEEVSKNSRPEWYHDLHCIICVFSFGGHNHIPFGFLL
jgi:hypothetical protein